MAKVGSNWKCPYCGHAQVLADERLRKHWHKQWVEGWKDERGTPTLFVQSIICANDACRELSLLVALATAVDRGARSDEILGPTKTWTLLPPSSAKPQPDYIPKPLRDDYQEACAIRDLS